jgi:ParB-like chromosome segregation protein Spo0J
MNITQQATHDTLVAVPLSQILDNPYQHRGHYDPEHILKLAASIQSYKNELRATQGLQQVPMARLVFMDGRSGEIQVAPRSSYAGNRAAQTLADDPTARVQLLFGHSRLRAFELLCEGLRALLKHGGQSLGFNLKAVPQIETDYAALLTPDLDYALMPMMMSFATDQAMWSHAITENSQRKNVTPIDEAKSLQRAMDEFGFTTEQAAKPFGWARSTAANKLRLLELPDDVQKQLATGELTERHGRELLRVAADPARVRKLAKEAVDKQLPVRRLIESVNWEEKELQRQQDKERQWKLATDLLAQGWRTPADQPMPTDRVQTQTDWTTCHFDKHDKKDRLLVEQNGCGPHCECLVLVWTNHREEDRYRPDPETMPNICLACTNREAYRTQCAALGDIDATDRSAIRQAAAERERKIEELNSAACAVWQRWLRDQDKHALWNSLAFWRVAAEQYPYEITRIMTSASDLNTVCDRMLQAMYGNTIEWNAELSAGIHQVEKVTELINALEGRVSQETAATNE